METSGLAMRELTEAQWEARRLAGADASDEVWDGEVVVAPDPDFEHQDTEAALLIWLRTWWVPSGEGHGAIQRMNVAEPGRDPWTDNFRIPDLLLWTAESAGRNRRTYWNGCPDVAVEIRSPGDRSFEKIETYLAWGAREVWIIDRDSRAPEVYSLDESGEVARRPFDERGHVRSELGITMRGHEGKLEIALEGVPDACASLP